MHKFDNTFFILLSKLSSIPTDFEGGFQYVDAVKGKLCLKMIPSDVTLLQDERFSKWVYLYRKNCQKFGENLTSAFAKLEDVEPVELPQVSYVLHDWKFDDIFQMGHLTVALSCDRRNTVRLRLRLLV